MLMLAESKIKIQLLMQITVPMLKCMNVLKAPRLQAVATYCTNRQVLRARFMHRTTLGSLPDQPIR